MELTIADFNVRYGIAKTFELKLHTRKFIITEIRDEYNEFELDPTGAHNNNILWAFHRENTFWLHDEQHYYIIISFAAADRDECVVCGFKADVPRVLFTNTAERTANPNHQLNLFKTSLDGKN